MHATPSPSPVRKTLATLLVLMLAGCATVPGEATDPVVEPPVAAAPSEPPPPAPAAVAPPAPAAERAAIAVHAARAPARAPLPVAEPARKAPVPAAPALIAEPPLDIAALKLRLRQTKALSTLTKLSLRGQMDKLIERFRAFHQSGQTSAAALRAPFDELVMKVLALLHKDDPALARSIAGSREAIWQILADPAKFHAAS